MVKKIDGVPWPETLDHVGVQLWEATRRWKDELDTGLVALGYPWAAEARGKVIMHVGRTGIPQSELVRRMGLSKQAVQQLIDELVSDGIVERTSEPGDGRSKRVVFTDAGRRFLGASNKVKRAIEARYRETLGAERFASLVAMLEELNRRDQ